MLGTNGPRLVVSHTRCSNAAAIVVMAHHLRNITGLSSRAVPSMKLSIQEAHLRRASPLVFPDEVFKAVGILLSIIVAFVPASFAIVGNAEGPPVRERNVFAEVVLERCNDFGFAGFGVHEG